MLAIRFHISRLALPFVFLPLAGCPGKVAEQIQEVQQEAQAAADFQDQMSQLRGLGAAYHSHIDTTGGPPASWEQLTAARPHLVALKDAGCVVAWGTDFRDAPHGVAEFALAYFPSALQNGGPVLMLDGSVANLTAEDLQQKLAAQQTPAP